jgi:hypothetical protein
MSLKLNGATSGYVEIDAPAVAGSTSITLPATSGGEFIVSDASGNIDLGALDISGSAAADSVNIDASGRLLVGTSSSIESTSKLQVKNGYLNLYHGDSAANSGYGIKFSTDGGATARTHGQIDLAQTAGNGGTLKFSTTADGASSPTERMRIRNDGNVGIANNGNANVRLFVNAPVSDSNNWSIFGNNAAGTNALGVRGDGAIYCGLLSHSPYNLLTAGAANAVLMSDGYFYRSTSSAKYKKDIETIDYAYSEALLNCRPVWYRSTSNADNPEWGWWGFIAEEVASIDPRLVHWKTTEPVAQENGTPKHAPCEPEPEGVAYDRFVPHLLNLIKRQKERIETLETQNASFEARLTALEGGQP